MGKKPYKSIEVDGGGLDLAAFNRDGELAIYFEVLSRAEAVRLMRFIAAHTGHTVTPTVGGSGEGE